MELFKILGRIAIDSDIAKKELDDTSAKAEATHSRMAGAFDKIGRAAAVCGKAVAAGMAAGATAMVGLVKHSVDQYAEYEQLIGGVETLFKDSQDKVVGYANNAYKTAGLSANEYMSTVTSFSASLLQSLDGDTEKAAEVANRAITDMADNANKMGSSMESIQNAYQGFAKQNYTMLDNLKLGYGGTKEEMQRLIKDANKLKKANGEMADLTIDSYADIIEAIGLVQDEMGITGTTAEEASETIQGSISSMKSAWTNFITGMADENQDFDVLLENLIDSMVTVADNLIPRIQMLLPRLVEGLNQIITNLMPYIAPLVEELLPGIIEGAVTLMTGLITALPDILAILLEQIPFIFEQIGAALIVAFPLLFDTIVMLFGQIWDWIAENLFGVEGNFEETFARIQEVVSVAFENIKLYWEEHLQPCFQAIIDFIQTYLAPIFKEHFETNILTSVKNAFLAIEDLWQNSLKPTLTGIIDFLTGVFSKDWELAWSGIVQILKGIFNRIPAAVEKAINAAISRINGLIRGVNKVSSWIGLGTIGEISSVTLPRMEEGGVLEKGQVGLLEGNGAEAVVPLDQNRKWISAVAREMQSTGIGASSDVVTDYFQRLIDILSEFFPLLLEAAGHDIVTNDGVIIARYAPLMNTELGKISARKGRGR